MKFLNVLFVCVFMFSCTAGNDSEDPYSESRELYKQALEIHDQVMPKMGELMQLQQQLKEKKGILADSAMAEILDHAIIELGKAHKDMMQWMHNIPKVPEVNSGAQNNPATGKPDPGAIKEQQQESLKKIEEVQKKMNTSIQSARDLLK